MSSPKELPQAGLSLRVIEQAIEEVEASLRGAEATGQRAEEKQKALLFLAELKGRLKPFCTPSRSTYPFALLSDLK